jgi:ABC-type Zn2+ transport system substrate-binding protein/surface adhesin
MMRPIRQMARWLRLAVAALFAVSAMTQVQAMSVAHAMKTMQQVEATLAHHHHHHHSDHSHRDHSDHSCTVADVAHDGSLCFAMGCCLALAAIGLGAPAASSVLLGVMAITSVRAMLPVSLDPADPPPRLQV